MNDSRFFPRGVGHTLILVACIVTVIFVIFVRIRLLDVPLERDEGEYAYIGQLMLQGIPPYGETYTMKLPGTPAVYALIMAMFGETTQGIHTGLLLVNIATIAMIFLLGRRLFDEVSGAASAVAYAILSLSPNVMGVFAHATHFVVLPMIVGVLILNKGITARNGRLYFLSGLFFGFSFVMKQHGIFFIFLGVSWLMMKLWCQGKNLLITARGVGLYLLGAALPFASICLYFAFKDVFVNFRFWTMDYAATYISEVPLEQGLRFFKERMTATVGNMLPIWFFAMIGLTTPMWDRKGRSQAGFLWLFLVFSFMAIFPGFYFREHYFILVLPAVSLLAGTAIGAFHRNVGKGKFRNILAKVTIPIFIASLLLPVVAERDHYFHLKPHEVSRKIYGRNPFPESVVIGSWIAASTKTGDRVAVLGSEPEIFFYAKRRSATGHIYMYGLMEPQPYASGMQKEAILEIVAARPKYIILVNINYSWLLRPDSDMSILYWMSDYVREGYNRVGVIDIVSPHKTAYIWGNAAASYQPISEHVVIFERKEERNTWREDVHRG